MKPAIAQSEAEFDERKAEWAFERAQLEQRLSGLQADHSRTAEQLRAADQSLCASQLCTRFSPFVLLPRRHRMPNQVCSCSAHITLVSYGARPASQESLMRLIDAAQASKHAQSHRCFRHSARFQTQSQSTRAPAGCRGELRHEKEALAAQLNEARAEFHAFKAEHEGLPAALRSARAQVVAAQADTEKLRPDAMAAEGLRAELDAARGEVDAARAQAAAAQADRDQYEGDVVKHLDTIAACTDKLAKRRADNQALAAEVCRARSFSGLAARGGRAGRQGFESMSARMRQARQVCR